MDKLKIAARRTAAKTDRQDAQLYLPVWMHALDTAGIMERLYREWLAGAVIGRLAAEVGKDMLPRVCILLALIHDLGKLTAQFQTNIQTQMDEYLLCAFRVPHDPAFYQGHTVPHARVGEAILLWYGFPQSFAVIVGAHHGKPQSDGVEIELEASGRCFYGTDAKKEKEAWERCWREYLDAALERCGFSSIDEIPTLSMSAQMELTGLLIMADWIASNTTYFPLISVDESGDTAWYPARVDAAWDALHLPPPWSAAMKEMDARAFEERFRFPPNEVQRAVLAAAGDASPGIFILEAGMGTGKTEASLALAEVLASRTGSGGLFFGLPTQATANGLFARVTHWAEQQSRDETHGIRLAHGASALNAEYQELFRGSANISDDEDGGLIVHGWFEGRKQALLADFVVGTVDQLLMASLKSKHLMLRHLGLAGKVVVIDEVHSFSPHMNAYLDRTLTWLGGYGAPVIILSATLPEERRAALIAAYLRGRAHQSKAFRLESGAAWRHSLSYPLITWTDGLTVRQTAVAAEGTPKTVVIERETLANLPERLRDALADGGCSGVVVNTVRRAQETATRLRAALPEMRVLVFHSQFVMADRARREQELLRLVGKASTPAERERLIIVGTQVIEQSLDLDFDLLATDLCPMDLLLQRIGRLHRHSKHTRPEKLRAPRCLVLEAEGEAWEPGAQAIYGAWLLGRTRRFLPDAIVLPGDIPRLVQNVYREPEIDALSAQEYADWTEFEQAKADAVGKANGYLLDAPKYSAKRQVPIDGMLDIEQIGSEQGAQASVRGGDSALEVLVLQRDEDGCLYLLDDPETPLDAGHVPPAETCREIAKQRLRLSTRFSKSWAIDEVIREPETMTAALAEWQQSPWLRGELFLLLDENGRTMLNGIPLRYSRADGLCMEKEEENAGNRI